MGLEDDFLKKYKEQENAKVSAEAKRTEDLKKEKEEINKLFQQFSEHFNKNLAPILKKASKLLSSQGLNNRYSERMDATGDMQNPPRAFLEVDVSSLKTTTPKIHISIFPDAYTKKANIIGTLLNRHDKPYGEAKFPYSGNQLEITPAELEDCINTILKAILLKNSNISSPEDFV